MNERTAEGSDFWSNFWNHPGGGEARAFVRAFVILRVGPWMYQVDGGDWWRTGFRARKIPTNTSTLHKETCE
eukprot:g13879.t1